MERMREFYPKLRAGLALGAAFKIVGADVRRLLAMVNFEKKASLLTSASAMKSILQPAVASER